MHTGFQRRASADGSHPALYGWDNEFGNLHERVQKFSVSEKLTSNAEFLNFVRDRGYDKEEYWSKEGWNWVSDTGSSYPKFWVNKSDKKNLDPSNFTLRLTLSETRDFWNLPVEVNCFEAYAYCRWLSKKLGKAIRLPTENEYYSMLQHIGFD